MQQRNNAWLAEFDLKRAPYRFDLNSATLVFERAGDQVVADLVVVATASDSAGTVLAGWANSSIPPQARRGLDKVRAFGEENGLAMLTGAWCHGGRPEGLELLACAGRILDAAGVFVHKRGEVTYFFALSNFRVHPRAAATDG
jgi:hypothetical protein